MQLSQNSEYQVLWGILFGFFDSAIFGEFIAPYLFHLLTRQSKLLMTPRKKTYENIVGIGENVGIWPKRFLSFPKHISLF